MEVGTVLVDLSPGCAGFVGTCLMCYSLDATQKSEWNFLGWGTARSEKHCQCTISEATVLSASEELLGLRARTTADQKSHQLWPLNRNVKPSGSEGLRVVSSFEMVFPVVLLLVAGEGEIPEKDLSFCLGRLAWTFCSPEDRNNKSWIFCRNRF